MSTAPKAAMVTGGAQGIGLAIARVLAAEGSRVALVGTRDAVAGQKVAASIGPEHIYYFHSLYFVGASQVAMGGDHLADAIMTFGTILKTPAKTDSQKRITELAHLALARIYYDRGQFTNAVTEYGKIGLKSEYLNEALYESALLGDVAELMRLLDDLERAQPQLGAFVTGLRTVARQYDMKRVRGLVQPHLRIN